MLHYNITLRAKKLIIILKNRISYVFIGIDQSITQTGIVVLNKNLKVEKAYSVSFSKYEHRDRFSEIYAHFSRLTKEYPSYVYGIEDYAFSKNFKREKMGELRGCIELALIHGNVNYYIIPIKHHRKVTYGNGNLSKEQCETLAIKMYGIQLRNLDEYDAFSIAVACSVVFKEDQIKKLINFQK